KPMVGLRPGQQAKDPSAAVDGKGATGPYLPGEGGEEQLLGEQLSRSGKKPARPVLGDYELLEELGKGGMGQVFKARHRKLGRVVALKVIRSRLLAHPQAVRRFQREVRAIARLSHPNIAYAYDAGQSNNISFLAMEYVE